MVLHGGKRTAEAVMARAQGGRAPMEGQHLTETAQGKFLSVQAGMWRADTDSLSVLSKRAAGEEPGSAESPDLGIASMIHTAKWLTSQLGTAKVCCPPQVLVKPQNKGGFNTKIFLSLGNDHFKGFRPTLFQQGKSSQLCLPDFRGGFVATRPHWAASIPRRALLLLPTSAPRTKDFRFPLKYHCHPVSLKLHKTESENVFAAEAFVSSASHVDLLVLNGTQPHAAEAQRNPQDSLPPLSHLLFTQI